jgi:hypothetical protein
MILLLSACKKEIDVKQIDPSLESNRVQLLKNWYEHQMATINNEKEKDVITLKTFKKQGTPAWDKTIFNETDNSYITPINIETKRPNDSIRLNKYLVTQMSEKGVINSGSICM